MRITYLLTGFGKTGGSIVLYNFMDNLVKRGYEVYAVTPSKRIKWENGMWKDLIVNNENKDIGIKKILKNTLKSVIRKQDSLNQLRKIISLNKLNRGLINHWIPSDVTIATYSLTAYAAYYLSDRTISLYHMQHYEEVFFEEYFDRLIARGTYTLPIYKVANSLWLKNILDKYYKIDSYLLNPGINLNIFKYDDNYQEKYTEKKEWTVLSYVDERREWKGFNDAVKAIKLTRERLEKEGYKIKWKLFGLNPPLRKYDTPFEYVGRLFNEDLNHLYKQMDIVLVPSWYESFPLPPIEAMASGTLVISTEFGVEDYLRDMVNGLVVLPRDTESMAKKIIWAIKNTDKVKELVYRGIETAKEYSWEKRTDVLEEIIKNVVIKHDSSKNDMRNDLVSGRFNEMMYDLFKIGDKNV